MYFIIEQTINKVYKCFSDSCKKNHENIEEHFMKILIIILLLQIITIMIIKRKKNSNKKTYMPLSC